MMLSSSSSSTSPMRTCIKSVGETSCWSSPKELRLVDEDEEVVVDLREPFSDVRFLVGAVVPPSDPAGRLNTSTVMGSWACRKASTASSWDDCETSLPFT